jgi:O-antigen/teichoic acid export membrane protein
MTVSNIVSPLMVSMDRFLIGATISMAAVAYYATPYEAITKLAIIPGALMGVLFPALSTTLASNRQQAGRLFRRTLTYVFLSLFPAVLVIVTFARPGLELWLGAEFARNSTVILQLLAVGVLINSLAYVPFGLIQADGRPDLTAKLHLAELPIYLAMLWFLVHAFGIIGAAIAWTTRVTVDAGALFVMARGCISRPAGPTRSTPLVGSASLTMLAIGAVLPGLPAKALFVVVSETLFLLAAWRWLMLPSDRAVVRGAIHKHPRS